jgi:NADPH:quinone reductase-like Zn-dependent oxidoreductase
MAAPSCPRVPLSVHDAILRCYDTVNLEQVRSGPMAGRAVLVTGGTGGIGKATAQACGHAHR